jgi:hypothetical protein
MNRLRPLEHLDRGFEYHSRKENVLCVQEGPRYGDFGSQRKSKWNLVTF